MNKKDNISKLVEETLKTHNMKLDKRQTELAIQIFKFIIVGGIATLIDWIIYFILCHFVNLNPLVSNIISFTISVLYNYWASCKYVFNVNNNKNKLIGFIILSIIGLGINELLLFIFVTNLKWNYMLVKIFATIIVMVFNFITRKIYLEKK